VLYELVVAVEVLLHKTLLHKEGLHEVPVVLLGEKHSISHLGGVTLQEWWVPR